MIYPFILMIAGTSAVTSQPQLFPYQLNVSIIGDSINVEHVIINNSQAAVCFYPDNASFEQAELYDIRGKKIANNFNYGVISRRTTIYFVPPDHKPSSFAYVVSPAEVGNAFDVRQLSSVKFVVPLFSCQPLLNGSGGLVRPIARVKNSKRVVRE